MHNANVHPLSQIVGLKLSPWHHDCMRDRELCIGVKRQLPLFQLLLVTLALVCVCIHRGHSHTVRLPCMRSNSFAMEVKHNVTQCNGKVCKMEG